MWLYLIFFIVGVIEDFIGTMTLRYLIAKRIWATTISTFAITIISLAVFYGIFIKIEEDPKRFLAILVYSLGISVGTFLAMKIKIRGGKNGNKLS